MWCCLFNFARLQIVASGQLTKRRIVGSCGNRALNINIAFTGCSNDAFDQTQPEMRHRLKWRFTTGITEIGRGRWKVFTDCGLVDEVGSLELGDFAANIVNVLMNLLNMRQSPHIFNQLIAFPSSLFNFLRSRIWIVRHIRHLLHRLFHQPEV